jgi:hypothetical protein
MKTSIWGSSAWTFLHAISFAYPEDPSPEHKEAALNMFSSLQLLLPCGECCSHYCSTFQRSELSSHLHSREAFSKWLVEFHNQVNRRLKKPEYSYEKAKQIFLNDEATCAIQSPCGEDHKLQTLEKSKLETQNPWILGTACVLLILLIVYIVRKK